MLKAGTRLSVRKDGRLETIIVGYLGKQLVIIDHEYKVHYPAFYSQDEDLATMKIRTPDETYYVTGMSHPLRTTLHLDFLPPYLHSFHLDDENGDIIVLASQEREEYRKLKLTSDCTEEGLNEKLDAYYYDDHLLPIALYRFTQSPFMGFSDVFNRQYSVWWEMDRVPLDDQLKQKLMMLAGNGYDRIADRDMYDFDESEKVYYIDRLDRMDYFFPLEPTTYSIYDLIEAGIVAIDPHRWWGYQAFIEDFLTEGDV